MGIIVTFSDVVNIAVISLLIGLVVGFFGGRKVYKPKKEKVTE